MGGCCSPKLSKYQLPNPKHNESFSNHIFLPMKVDERIKKIEKEVEIESFSLERENFDFNSSLFQSFKSEFVIEEKKQDNPDDMGSLEDKDNSLKIYVSSIPTNTPFRLNKTMFGNELKSHKNIKVYGSKEQENCNSRKKAISDLHCKYQTNYINKDINNRNKNVIFEYPRNNYVL